MQLGEIEHDKKAVRMRMLAMRRALSHEARQSKSKKICNSILERAEIKKRISLRENFAVYLATDDEVDLTALILSLYESGCKVSAPRWNPEMGTYELAELENGVKHVVGRMGIWEPPPSACSIHPKDVSVWIVPGLAFSRNGARLGYGGGWYDRFLASASDHSISVGVAYEFQIMNNLPQNMHDLPVDYVVCA